MLTYWPPAPLERKDAHIDFGIAEIGRDAHGRHRDQRSQKRGGCLFPEDFGHVALDLAGDFLLPCRFHIS